MSDKPEINLFESQVEKVAIECDAGYLCINGIYTGERKAVVSRKDDVSVYTIDKNGPKGKIRVYPC